MQTNSLHYSVLYYNLTFCQEILFLYFFKVFLFSLTMLIAIISLLPLLQCFLVMIELRIIFSSSNKNPYGEIIYVLLHLWNNLGKFAILYIVFNLLKSDFHLVEHIFTECLLCARYSLNVKYINRSDKQIKVPAIM